MNSRLLLLAALLVVPPAGAGLGPLIEDVRAVRPAGSFEVTISARLRGPAGVFAPMVFWRSSGEKAFTADGLLHTGDRYQAVLRPQGTSIEYFLEAFDEKGGGPTRAGNPDEPLAFPETARRAPRRVAVLEFENELDKGEKIDRVYFSDAVRGTISESKAGLLVMTRENVLQLLAASGKKLEECASLCEVETGRLLGADLVVSGRLTKVGRRYKLTLRLHRTAEGTMVGSATASGDSVEQLDDETAKAVTKLIASL